MYKNLDEISPTEEKIKGIIKCFLCNLENWLSTINCKDNQCNCNIVSPCMSCTILPSSHFLHLTHDFKNSIASMG